MKLRDHLRIVTCANLLFIGCACTLAAVTVLSLAIFMALFILPSTVNKPHVSEVLLYENTSAAVENFPTFKVNKVYIHQDPELPESVHNMEIFLATESCDSLPHYTLPSKSQSLSPPQNKTLYLLKGSELNYNICAATNESHKSRAYLNFYIVSGLEDIKRGGRPQSNVHRYTIYLGYSKSLPYDKQPNSDWKCHNILYTIDKNGYYSTLLFYPSNVLFEDMKFWHETENSYKLIKLHSLPAFCKDSATHVRDETCDIKIGSSMHNLIHQYQCAVVDVRTNANTFDTSNFTRVVVAFSYRSVGQTWCYSVGGVLLGVFVVLVIIIASCGVYHFCTRTKYRPQNVPAAAAAILCCTVVH